MGLPVRFGCGVKKILKRYCTWRRVCYVNQQHGTNRDTGLHKMSIQGLPHTHIISGIHGVGYTQSETYAE